MQFPSFNYLPIRKIIMPNKEKLRSFFIENKLFRCIVNILIGAILLYVSSLELFANEAFSFLLVFSIFLFVASIYFIYKNLLLLVFGLPKLRINGDRLEYYTIFKKQSFPIDKVFITKQRLIFERFIYIKVDNKKLIFYYYSLDDDFRKALGI